MYVLIGNENAIETYRDERSDDPERLRFRELEGKRITEVRFPEETSVQEAFTTMLGLLPRHIASDAKPAWIETDSAGLRAILRDHFEMTHSQMQKPEVWGDEDQEDDDSEEE